MAAVGSVDVELELIGWLQDKLGEAVVVRDELDNNLLDELPTVQVQVVGGGDDGFRLDRPLVDIDVYDDTRAGAWALSATIRALLAEELRGSKATNAVFGAVEVIARAAPRPYENTGLRRVGATYQIFCHPVS